jgi:ligand-binding sensor domain-containing protein
MQLKRIMSASRSLTKFSGAPRLAESPRTRKRNCVGWGVALAISVALAALGQPAPTAGARDAAPVDVWHVGPIPGVRAICHVGEGLWVGTAAGLYLIDIRNAAIVGHVPAGARLPSSSVRAIIAKGDSVFVGTDAGLALFRRAAKPDAFDARVFTTSAPGPLAAVPLTRIAGLSVGVNGDVLLATSGRGVGVITKRGGYSITRRDSLLEDKVFAIADRVDGTRYFATSVGLCAQMNDTSFVSFQAGSGIPRGEVRAVVNGERNTFYLLIANHGVFRFDGSKAVALASPKGIRLRDANSISFGREGTLWVAGKGWVYARRGDKWTQAPITEADANADWRVIVADGAGAFAGSSDGRVLALGRGGTLRVQLPGGLPASRVQSLSPDGTGSAWFVCDGRLVHADAGSRSVTVLDTPTDVRAVDVSSSGEVWTAGRWTVRRRTGDVWLDARPDVVESDPAFTALTVDDDGTWVGTRSGALYHFDGRIWLRHARASGSTGAALAEVAAAGPSVWSLAQGRAARSYDGGWKTYAGLDSGVVDLTRTPGGMWVAATERRVFVFDESKGAWRHAPVPEWCAADGKELGPLRGHIRAIAFDSGGRLVLGTTEGVGLCGKQGVRWLTAADGLGGGEVADLAVDGERIWVGFVEDGVSVIATRGLW